MPLFGVYIHFPYCVSKCPYCDFASIVAEKIPHVAYGAAIRAELAAAAPPFAGRAVSTVFFGGGTPSLWSPDEVAATLDTLRARFPFDPRAEVTLEANPGTVDVDILRALRASGVNRLSIGVQSLDDATLAALGRAHDAAAARRAVDAARTAGFDNLSVDLMFGVEGQSLEAWAADLEGALAFETEHISLYALTPEAGTPLGERVARGKTTLPPDDTVASMLEYTHVRTARAGFERYEVSNYARPGRRCAHNQLYWQGGEWLAAGVGAHAFHAGRNATDAGRRSGAASAPSSASPSAPASESASAPSFASTSAPSSASTSEPSSASTSASTPAPGAPPPHGTRWWNTRAAEAYLRAAAAGFPRLEGPAALPPPWAAGSETIDAPTALRERLFTGLRTADGLDLAELGALYGASALAPVETALRRFETAGLLTRDAAPGTRLRPTPRGLDVADGIAADAMAAVPTPAPTPAR